MLIEQRGAEGGTALQTWGDWGRGAVGERLWGRSAAPTQRRDPHFLHSFPDPIPLLLGGRTVRGGKAATDIIGGGGKWFTFGSVECYGKLTNIKILRCLYS